MNTQFPDPRTELGVIKRYLHVLALLQNNKDAQDWNGTTLADILSYDEEEPVLDKTVREYIREYLKTELNIPVEMGKGKRRIELADEIDETLQVRLASIYADFVIADASRVAVMKQLVRAHRYEALWLMARLYFATKKRNIVSFNYTTNSGYRLKRAKFHPWYLTLRNHSLYLVGRLHGKEKPWVLILNRVEDLIVEDEHYTEEPIAYDDIFSDTLGSFVGQKHDVLLRVHERAIIPMEQFLNILEPSMEKEDDSWFRLRFTLSDDTYLCKHLLLFGGDVEIIEPQSLRDTMVRLLQESLRVYE